MNLTRRCKARFSQSTLSLTNSKIGFVDVGSGGKLKHPWDLLPPEKLRKIDFEPTEEGQQSSPTCISNRIGKSKFYIAEDERSSSLHEPCYQFVERFGQQSMLAQKTIEVQLTTLDEVLKDQYEDVDLIDFNVEGHDFQALEGSTTLLQEGFIKLIKVEFALAGIWQGQGWFSDIDSFLRAKEFDLANIEIEFSKPANVRKIFHQGQPLWGKAYYVPALSRWQRRLDDVNSVAEKMASDVIKGILLYTLTDIPGRAVDVLRLVDGKDFGVDTKDLEQKILKTFRFALWDKAVEECSRILKFPLKLMRK